MQYTWEQWQEMKARPVKGMTIPELKEELAEHKIRRSLSARYYEVQREFWNRCNIENNKRMVTGAKDYE